MMLDSLKRKRVPPKWVLNLPPGKYGIHDLYKITGLKGHSLTNTLRKYGATVEKHPAKNNLYFHIFVWPGINKVLEENNMIFTKIRNRVSIKRVL